MKKILFFTTSIALSTMMFFGCASAPKAQQNAEQKIVPEKPTNSGAVIGVNATVDAMQSKIIDWDGRTTGIDSAKPQWLKTMVRGNGTMYCREFGKEDALTRKFITPSAARNVNLNNALNEAQVETAYALGQEMAMTINGTMGNSLTDGQKSQVRDICIGTNASVSGLRFEGSFWQRIIDTDPYGNQNDYYLAYAFYSMSQNTYNELLNIYLISILQSKGLDKTAVNAIAAKAEEILNDAQATSEKQEKQREREQERLLAEYDMNIKLSDNETRQIEARANAQQVQARADASARRSEAASAATVNSAAATGSLISPALAAAIRNAQ